MQKNNSVLILYRGKALWMWLPTSTWLTGMCVKHRRSSGVLGLRPRNMTNTIMLTKIVWPAYTFNSNYMWHLLSKFVCFFRFVLGKERCVNWEISPFPAMKWPKHFGFESNEMTLIITKTRGGWIWL